MASLTIKKIDERVLQRLRKQARQKSTSLNALVKELLARSVGLSESTRSYDDLSDVAGCWTDEDVAEFRQNTRPFEEVDDDLWR